MRSYYVVTALTVAGVTTYTFTGWLNGAAVPGDVQAYNFPATMNAAEVMDLIPIALNPYMSQ